jgi:hypothetical protein
VFFGAYESLDVVVYRETIFSHKLMFCFSIEHDVPFSICFDVVVVVDFGDRVNYILSFLSA